MIPYTFSLHKIDNITSFGFDANDYSRFKFGDDLVAKSFGKDLADAFIKYYLTDNLITDQIVVISSPYSFIPTATFSMKNYFVSQLNRWLIENGGLAVQETKVHRTITYKEDYGELSAEERIHLIGNDSFHIDKDFLAGKTLLFLDDIRITGSHEKMILKMAKQYGLTNETHMVYFAELINKNIHPNIENFLNYHQVKSIFDLEEIIDNGHFSFNTRIVKYLLNTSFDSFSIFLQRRNHDFINKLYDLSLGNSYHLIENYSENLHLIKNYINNNNYKLI